MSAPVRDFVVRARTQVRERAALRARSPGQWGLPLPTPAGVEPSRPSAIWFRDDTCGQPVTDGVASGLATADVLRFPDPAALLMTFAEAAARLRVPQRTLRLLVSRHSPPVIKAGRRILFDENAINYLIGNLRCPSKSSPAPTAACSGLSARSAANAFERALALTTPISRKKSAPTAKRRSTAPTSTA